jgi:hypothetical protein
MRYTGTIEIAGRIAQPIKLQVTKRPSKTVYQVGDYFNPRGMVVTCIYNDGSSMIVTNDVNFVYPSLFFDAQERFKENAKYVTITYHENASNVTLTTNLVLNVNAHQKELVKKASFKEQYEITRVLFRSKKSEDDTYDNANTIEEYEDNDDFNLGKWIDITPAGNNSVLYPEDSTADQPIIKAGYGFELKVFTRYRTNRSGAEFAEFLKKSQWDDAFSDKYPSISGEINTKWKYLNDVYPQATPTANPDILYIKISNTNNLDSEGNAVNTVLDTIGENDHTYYILDKTNRDEANIEIDEGNWYDSTKIFEIREREVIKDGTKTRRIYVSRDAAQSDSYYTDYNIQIISPAWYGYEPEPIFANDEFVSIFDEKADALNLRKIWAAEHPYLHVCMQFTLRVLNNDDIHTHILQ